VQHGQHGHAAVCHGADRLQHLVLVGEIEAGRRLVQHQAARAGLLGRIELAEHAGQVHALLLAAGERAVSAGAQMQDIGASHGTLDSGLVFMAPCGVSVRAAAQRHDILRRHGKANRAGLRQHSAPAGQRPARDRGERLAVHPHGARIRRELARGHAHQCRFAGTVRAEQGEEFAWCQSQHHVAQQGAAATDNADTIEGDHPRSRRRLTSSHRKKGPPMALVTSPMGSSAGTTAVRATRSAMRIRIAPAMPEAGSTIA
jgi:hypothetical protein